MKDMHDAATLKEITGRINNLKPDSERKWGKMNVAQMMAHCANALETNLGDVKVKQTFMGKIFGKIAKRSLIEKPIKQGLPTAPEFLITGERQFDAEKQRLTKLLARLFASDPGSYAQNPHPFFGKMTPNEWNHLNYKHLDHHLRQFGA